MVLLAYLVFLAWVLVLVFGRINRIAAEPLHLFVLLLVKLVAIVVLPAAIFLALGHYSIAELMPISLKWRDLRPALWMSIAALLMQSVLGRGLHDIREAHVTVWVVAVAAPLSFAWLIIEVGVVEEFLSRTAAGAACGMVRFGMGRVGCSGTAVRVGTCAGFLPTLGGDAGALGAHPSLLMAIGYSIDY